MTARSTGGQLDEIAEHAVAEGVMGDLAYALVLIGGHADDVKDERALSLGAHHAVER